MTEHDRLAVVVRVPSGMEAAILVNALVEHGIQASSSGEFTAGFRAEAPGDVAVMVHADKLVEARQIIQDLKGQTP